MNIRCRLYALVLLTALATTLSAQPSPGRGAVVFEGARLVNSDGTAPLENAAFIVENGHFAAIGAKGAVTIPNGATRVDLTGKTVIPALVDAHAHLGYMRDLTIGPDNYTRENLEDHLRRDAYHGVAAGSTWGSDFGELPFQIRDQVLPGAARFVTLGRGLTTPGEGTPDNMRQNAFVVATEQDGRQAVRELSARRIRMVKTWVQDREGVPKLTPSLYRAIVDEAHQHGMQLVVHAMALADVKELLRAGADGFAHLPNDVDAELMDLLKARPDTFFTPTLGTNRRAIYHPWLEGEVEPLVRETVSPEQIRRLQERFASMTPAAAARARQNWDKARQVFQAFQQAGVRIGLGSDAGGNSGDQFIGWTAHTEIENMVDAGMTPAQALVACTRTAADILGLSDLGTIKTANSADFVVLDANPLDDIRNTRRISSVYLRGQRVDRKALSSVWKRRQG